MNLQYLFPLFSSPAPPLSLFFLALTAEPSHNILKIAAAISCELELGVNGRKGAELLTRPRSLSRSLAGHVHSLAVVGLY